MWVNWNYIFESTSQIVISARCIGWLQVFWSPKKCRFNSIRITFFPSSTKKNVPRLWFVPVYSDYCRLFHPASVRCHCEEIVCHVILVTQLLKALRYYVCIWMDRPFVAFHLNDLNCFKVSNVRRFFFSFSTKVALFSPDKIIGDCTEMRRKYKRKVEWDSESVTRACKAANALKTNFDHLLRTIFQIIFLAYFFVGAINLAAIHR